MKTKRFHFSIGEIANLRWSLREQMKAISGIYRKCADEKTRAQLRESIRQMGVLYRKITV